MRCGEPELVVGAGEVHHDVLVRRLAVVRNRVDLHPDRPAPVEQARIARRRGQHLAERLGDELGRGERAGEEDDEVVRRRRVDQALHERKRLLGLEHLVAQAEIAGVGLPVLGVPELVLLHVEEAGARLLEDAGDLAVAQGANGSRGAGQRLARLVATKLCVERRPRKIGGVRTMVDRLLEVARERPEAPAQGDRRSAIAVAAAADQRRTRYRIPRCLLEAVYVEVIVIVFMKQRHSRTLVRRLRNPFTFIKN